jgi:hypothetical protein
MALETLNDIDWRSLYRPDQPTFQATHLYFLTLQHFLAKAGPCFAPYLPGWRRLRDAWSSFYAGGTAYTPERQQKMLWFRGELMKQRQLYFQACGKQATSNPGGLPQGNRVPLYASIRYDRPRAGYSTGEPDFRFLKPWVVMSGEG